MFSFPCRLTYCHAYLFRCLLVCLFDRLPACLLYWHRSTHRLTCMLAYFTGIDLLTVLLVCLLTLLASIYSPSYLYACLLYWHRSTHRLTCMLAYFTGIDLLTVLLVCLLTLLASIYSPSYLYACLLTSFLTDLPAEVITCLFTYKILIELVILFAT